MSVFTPCPHGNAPSDCPTCGPLVGLNCECGHPVYTHARAVGYCMGALGGTDPCPCRHVRLEPTSSALRAMRRVEDRVLRSYGLSHASKVPETTAYTADLSMLLNLVRAILTP